MATPQTLADLMAIVATKTAFVLAECSKVQIGISPFDGTAVFEFQYINKPAQYKLHTDPILDAATSKYYAVLEAL